MTRYATTTDLARLGVRATALVGVSSTEQEAALDAASAWADTFLRKRHTVPLTGTIDPALVEAVCQRAAYRILQPRGFDATNASDLTIRDGGREAEDFLKAVELGHRHLITTDEETEDERQETFSVSNARRGWLRR